jgi:hypothetical protein
MLERGSGRIVITGSGAAYLPGGDSTAYAPSKAAVCRYGEMLANERKLATGRYDALAGRYLRRSCPGRGWVGPGRTSLLHSLSRR